MEMPEVSTSSFRIKLLEIPEYHGSLVPPKLPTGSFLGKDSGEYTRSDLEGMVTFAAPVHRTPSFVSRQTLQKKKSPPFVAQRCGIWVGEKFGIPSPR